MDTTATAPTPAQPADLAAAHAILPWIVGWRRRLHACPEVGLQLPATRGVVLEALAELGLEPTLDRTTSGITAVIRGARPGPVVLLRADMDGLPLTEETGLPFSSAHEGRMHACGHDTHVAMLLGAAKLLLASRDTLAGSVLLMLQPGEEGFHGARYMLDEGLLDRVGERASAAFALHISSQYPAGTIALRPGPFLASADRIQLTITGRGGHASAPHLALDPITVAAELIVALQLMVTRRVDIADPVVLTITRLDAGTTNNIIPERAVLEGTIRTLSAENRQAMRDRLRQVAEGVCAAHGATVAIEIDPGFPVTVNDPGFTALARGVAEAVLGPGRIIDMSAPIMGAEDFSYVLEQVPGAMCFLGAMPEGADPETVAHNHSNRVIFDEASMAAGAAVYAAVARRVTAGA